VKSAGDGERGQAAPMGLPTNPSTHITAVPTSPMPVIEKYAAIPATQARIAMGLDAGAVSANSLSA